MLKPICNLIILSYILIGSAAAAEEKILFEQRLKGLNVTAVAPDGWWVDTHVYSISTPGVTFTLPHPLSGPYEAGPELSVHLVNPELNVHTLGLYEKYLRRDDIRSKKPLKIFYFSSGSRRGFVYATKSFRMVDFVGGTGMKYETIFETVILQDGNRLFSCNLITRPEKYTLYKGAAAKLCTSLRFDPAVK